MYLVMDNLPAETIGTDQAAQILEITVFYIGYGTVILFRDPQSFPIGFENKYFFE